jgi:dienelactone hydrolase
MLDSIYIPASGWAPWTNQTASLPVFTPRTGQFIGSDSAFFPHAFGQLIPGVRANSSALAEHAVVVVPEWWGVSQTELDMAEELSSNGYLVVVPNIYRERIPFDDKFQGQTNTSVLAKLVLDEVFTASWKMSHLAWDFHSDNILDVVTHLKKVQGFDKVAVMGFSEGSCLALLAASQTDKMQQRGASIDGIVAFYGTPLKAGEKYTGDAYRNFDATRIKIPTQLISGAKDPFTGFSDPASMKIVQQSIGSHVAKFSEIDGVDHGFMANAEWWEAFKASTTPPRVPYSQAARDRAWSIVNAFSG